VRVLQLLVCQCLSWKILMPRSCCWRYKDSVMHVQTPRQQLRVENQEILYWISHLQLLLTRYAVLFLSRSVLDDIVMLVWRVRSSENLYLVSLMPSKRLE